MDIENSKEENLGKDQERSLKLQESQDFHDNKMFENSPCCIHQIQKQIVFWVEIIKKYNEDPDVIIILHQMNEILQKSNQTSSQKQFNFTTKQSNFDDQSLNHSFKQDMFQKMNENIILLQEEIKNQACSSPKTIEHGKYFNESCSEIIQQFNKIYVVKNDQIDKEFDQSKSKFSGSNYEEPHQNTLSEIDKQSYQFDFKKKKKIFSFKNKQHIHLNEFKKSLTDIKTVVEQRFQREISIFKDDILSEHSKFSNSYSELQEQVNIYKEMIHEFQFKIENLEKIIQTQSQEIENKKSSFKNYELYIQQLARFFQNDENYIENIEDAKKKIMDNIQNQKQQVQSLSEQLQMIEKNNKIMLQLHENENQLNKNQFETEKKLLEYQIINLKNSQNEKERNYQQLVQELEQLRYSDQIQLNQELIKIGEIQMKQQQQLIQIAVKVLQQFINSTAFELNVAQNLQEQQNKIKQSEKEVLIYINDQKCSQKSIIEHFNDIQENIQKIVQILCSIYKKVIEWIINQRRELEIEQC
ncbi:unnamed protein product [Paramecium sonneborni]|uniref:Uncharacterized protein n=1 Tax=Paramecium sonneborni TaxID=65129 RepID=A0A8S1L0Y8_9CILI|nr:unnamed protein product [Paramecium sonneborni]